MVEGRYRPTKVTASATTGIATSMGCDPKTEDTITLLVDWQNIKDEKQRGTAVYTASWAAPLKAGVHSEQRFHYMAEKVGSHFRFERVELTGVVGRGSGGPGA
jgi:D-galacturonate reductase